MRLHAEGNPQRRPGIPDPLWQIITRCLAGEPRLRPSAAELVTELGNLNSDVDGVPALPAAPRPSSPSPVPAPRRRAARNDASPNRWVRPGATAALIAGTMLASGIATTAWHLGRSRDEPLTVVVAPSAPPVVASSVAPRRLPSRPPATRPAKPRKAAPGVALPAPEPHAAVRAKPTAVTRRATRAPVPEGKPYGPWQCSQNFVFDLAGRMPLGPRPCHSVGRDVQFQASLTAPAGGRARIEVRLQDARTGRTVAGPTTCADLTFTRESFTHRCGPAGATPSRGRTYAVVMTYRYERDGRTAASTARGRPFTW